MNSSSPIQLTGQILLVDDLPENIRLLSSLLLQLGYSVRSVTSGRMALKTAKVKRPDIILLDIKMPDMDGYQVCQALKADKDLQDIPVIFVSALDDVLDKVKAFWSGGADYICKPFHGEEVVVRLENQLTIHRQKRALQDEIARRLETEEMLYQSRALITSVLNSVLDGIAAMQSVRDPSTGYIVDFSCIMVNPVIARIFDRSREELIGKSLVKNFLEQGNPRLFGQLVNVVKTGICFSGEICYPTESEGFDPIWYQIIAIKLGDGLVVTMRHNA